ARVDVAFPPPDRPLRSGGLSGLAGKGGEPGVADAADLGELAPHVEVAGVGGDGVGPGRGVGPRVPVLDPAGAIEGRQVLAGHAVGAVLPAAGVGAHDVVVVAGDVDAGGRLQHRHDVAVGLHLPHAGGRAVGPEGVEAAAGAAGGGVERVTVTAAGEAPDRPVHLGLPRCRPARGGV